MSDRENSQNRSSMHSGAEIDEAENNLAECLEALDREGDKGLRRTLERIYPDNPERVSRLHVTKAPTQASEDLRRTAIPYSDQQSKSK